MAITCQSRIAPSGSETSKLRIIYSALTLDHNLSYRYLKYSTTTEDNFTMEPSAKRVKQMREAACHDVTSSTREAELEKQIEQTKRKLKELEQDLRAERAEKKKEVKF